MHDQGFSCFLKTRRFYELGFSGLEVVMGFKFAGEAPPAQDSNLQPCVKLTGPVFALKSSPHQQKENTVTETMSTGTAVDPLCPERCQVFHEP